MCFEASLACSSPSMYLGSQEIEIPVTISTRAMTSSVLPHLAIDHDSTLVVAS